MPKSATSTATIAPVMFLALAVLNTLHQCYRVQFAEPLTDNEAEFAGEAHPFEAMPRELGSSTAAPGPIGREPTARWSASGEPSATTHRGHHLRQPRPFRHPTRPYLIYCNELRPHRALQGQTPRGPHLIPLSSSWPGKPGDHSRLPRRRPVRADFRVAADGRVKWSVPLRVDSLRLSD